MKNKRVILLVILFNIGFYFYSQPYSFTVMQDCSWYNDMKQLENLQKNETLYLRDDVGIGFTYNNIPKEIEISVTNSYDDILYVPIQFLAFDENKQKISKYIKDYYWVPSYYYEQINSKTDRYTILYKNEIFWNNWKNQFENASTWQDDFLLGYYGFNDFYFFARSSYVGTNEATFLVKTEESNNDYIKYNVFKMYSHFQKYTKRTANPQEKFLSLYEKETPFYIYLTIDGDYMNVYIDEISEKTLFQTLIRTTPEACNQIENWIKGKSNDLSKVEMPKHGKAETMEKEVYSTNVAKNKTMLVNENLKLRSGEATSTQVLTVMSAGTKVKILELGKAETIDGISSNWVKVEVQKGAKDRDGNPIKAGTVGWCYGGYLK